MLAAACPLAREKRVDRGTRELHEKKKEEEKNHQSSHRPGYPTRRFLSQLYEPLDKSVD